jgi:tRNA U34 2-thiouridine synthase MnmA/TrmU
MRGFITKANAGLYDVYSEGVTYQCKARGKFRIGEYSPLVGDEVEFDEKQKAITPGQFVVLYQAEGDKIYCLGGGQIDKVMKDGEILHI